MGVGVTALIGPQSMAGPSEGSRLTPVRAQEQKEVLLGCVTFEGTLEEAKVGQEAGEGAPGRGGSSGAVER